MDRIDFVESSDATPEPEAASPFAPRLRRAVLTLMAAIATHVWLLPPSGSDGVLPGMAQEPSQVVAKSGLAIPSALGLKGEPNREHARKTAPASVQVRTQFITLTPPAVVNRGTRPPSAIERPVGTTGFLRAAAEMPVPRSAVLTAAEMLPSPVQMLEFTESRAVMTADVPPRLETPEPDAPAAGRAKTSSPEIEAIPAMFDRAPERKKVVDLKKADLTNQEKEQEEIVRRVLLDYKQAYDQLDVNSLKAIWPSLDDRKLQRAFRGLEGQELRFAKCGVSVTGQGAKARCQGDATYRPKVGSRVHVQEAEWTFSLARANDRWQIVNASLQ